METDFPKLKEPRGAFVTIYKKGELRGCIGQILPRMPLAEAVAAMAEEAAFRDPRFVPVRSEELGDLTIEISVLTPLQKIHSTDEIEVGKHGIVIARSGSMGLLLPQVATEYGWNRTEFLENCCLKAGLASEIPGRTRKPRFISSRQMFFRKGCGTKWMQRTTLPVSAIWTDEAF